MSRIFTGQSALRIRVTVGQDLTGALETRIDGTKPDGTTVAWDAAVEDAAAGIIYRDMSSETDLDQTGWWKFRAFVRFADNRSAYGEEARVKVHAIGE